MSQHPLFAALESLAPTIQEHAPEADRTGRFPDAVINAIADAGLFRLWIPATYQGYELPLPDSLALFEAASRIDGAAGWLVTIGVGGGLFAAQMHPDTAREVYRSQRALIAGSGAPTGTATPTDGGYRVTGRWKYASGVHHATWVTANCVIEDGADPPSVRAIAIPARDVEVIPTWDTIGMRATGSHDIHVQDAFVPHHHTFDVFGEPREPGPLYRVPFGGIAQLSFAAVALGVARHALDVFPDGLSARRSDSPEARTAATTGEADLHAARKSFFQQATEAWRTTQRDDELESEAQEALHAAAVHASRTSVAVVERLFLAAGMAPLTRSSVLGRCWRDVHTVSQHIALAPPSATS